MAHVAYPAAQFDVLNDTSFTSAYESDQSTDHTSFIPLGNIPVNKAQNRQSARQSSGRVESLAADLEKFHIGDTHVPEPDQLRGKPIPNLEPKSQPGCHPACLCTSHNIFQVLETVPENNSHDSSTSEAVSVSDQTQHFIQVPVDQYTQHPLALAARNLPSAQDQLKKHLEGDFEWVLTIRVPKQASSGTKNVPHAKNEETCDTVKLYFGCNIYPGVKALHEIREPPQQESYTLLVTPLEDNAELDTATDLKNDETSMALSANIAEHAMLLRPLDKQPDVRVTELSPPRSTFSEDDSFVDPIPSRSPAKSIARIEDSVEALDQLEEQLEAFDVAASMRDAASHEVKKPTERVPVQSLTSNMHENRGATPRSSNGSPMVRLSTPRVKITGPRRYPSSGRPASMISMGSPKLLDSLKLKVEDKALLQAPPKKSAKKELTSLLPPKQPAKSTKRVTVAAFELPGEAVARRLKEQREARLSMAVTSETPKVSAVSGIGRPKSGKPPTRPIFELPGEAISRRKREERDARLKAQEEEERRRRDFKAKPVRSAGAPSSIPRGTATSRARQLQGPVSENAPRTSPGTRKKVSFGVPHEPLSVASNQAQPRGRHLTTDSSQISRATSSSTGSLSGKRTSVSFEDVQAQRLRGREVLQRDSMYAQDRQRDKRDRETITRLAREQAAERSRLQSRQWAEEQKRKLKTVGPLGNTVALST